MFLKDALIIIFIAKLCVACGTTEQIIYTDFYTINNIISTLRLFSDFR